MCIEEGVGVKGSGAGGIPRRLVLRLAGGAPQGRVDPARAVAPASSLGLEQEIQAAAREVAAESEGEEDAGRVRPRDAARMQCVPPPWRQPRGKS